MTNKNLQEVENLLNATTLEPDFEVNEVRNGGKTNTTVNWYFV